MGTSISHFIGGSEFVRILGIQHIVMETDGKTNKQTTIENPGVGVVVGVGKQSMVGGKISENYIAKNKYFCSFLRGLIKRDTSN